MKIEEVSVVKVEPDDVIVIDSDVAMPDGDAEWEAMHDEYRQAFPTNFLIFIPGGASALTVMRRDGLVATLQHLADNQKRQTL